jgi:hypothetical protein
MDNDISDFLDGLEFSPVAADNDEITAADLSELTKQANKTLFEDTKMRILTECLLLASKGESRYSEDFNDNSFSYKELENLQKFFNDKGFTTVLSYNKLWINW